MSIILFLIVLASIDLHSFVYVCKSYIVTCINLVSVNFGKELKKIKAELKFKSTFFEEENKAAEN